jgi:hypothetical protein
VKILQKGCMDLATWAVQIHCHCCAMVAEVTYLDITFQDPAFVVTCPTDRCGSVIRLIEERIPKVARMAVKQQLNTGVN